MTTTFLLALALAASGDAAEARTPVGATTTEVYVSPFGEPLPQGSVTHSEGRVVYTAPFLKWLAAKGTTIHLRVLDAPGWAFASVHPSEIETPPAVALNEAYTAVSNFTLTVAVSEIAPPDQRAPLRIRACAEPNGLLEGSCGEDTVLVWTPARKRHHEPHAHDARAPTQPTPQPTPQAPLPNSTFEITQDDLDGPPEVIDADTEEPLLVTVAKYGALGALAGMGAFLARGGKPD